MLHRLTAISMSNGPTSAINCWGGLVASASNGTWNKVFIPVKKGQEIKYQISGTILYAGFVKLVGGGKLLKTLFCKEVCYVA